VKVLIHVDARLIARGYPRSACGCPVSLAVTEATGARRMSVITSPDTVSFFTDSGSLVSFPLPREAVRWVEAFDESDLPGQPRVEPISFELEISDEFVAPGRRCPRCGEHMLNMCHVGFKASGLDSGGYCYQWDAGTYTCLKPCIKERK
jgi:hypothetical protein